MGSCRTARPSEASQSWHPRDETLGRNRGYHCKPGHCRNAKGGAAETSTKLGLLQRTELGVSKRDTKHQSPDSVTPFATLGKAGQEEETTSWKSRGIRTHIPVVILSKISVLPLGFNSRPPDGPWLPGPSGKVRTYPQAQAPRLLLPSGEVNQMSGLEDEGEIVNMPNL